VELATIVTVAASAVVVVGAVVASVRAGRRIERKVDQMQRDWYGEAARPGFPARPGVPERLETIENQLKPNGGSSARDAINRVELNQHRLSIDHAILARRMDSHLEQVAPAIAELNEWQKSRNAINEEST
jgi:hypothetical protein